jgi:hypothetical protein
MTQGCRQLAVPSLLPPSATTISASGLVHVIAQEQFNQRSLVQRGTTIETFIDSVLNIQTERSTFATLTMKLIPCSITSARL